MLFLAMKFICVAANGAMHFSCVASAAHFFVFVAKNTRYNLKGNFDIMIGGLYG